jgi:CheY-like chemotaxis protein
MVAPHLPLGKASILVVEDEFLIAIELQSILEDAGATVIGPASSIEEALPLVSPELSCALLDLRLGQTLVTPVAEKLKALGIPFAFYSGQLPGEFTDWPEAPLLQKPSRPASIVRTMKSLISSEDQLAR